MTIFRSLLIYERDSHFKFICYLLIESSSGWIATTFFMWSTLLYSVRVDFLLRTGPSITIWRTLAGIVPIFMYESDTSFKFCLIPCCVTYCIYTNYFSYMPLLISSASVILLPHTGRDIILNRESNMSNLWSLRDPHMEVLTERYDVYISPPYVRSTPYLKSVLCYIPFECWVRISEMKKLMKLRSEFYAIFHKISDLSSTHIHYFLFLSFSFDWFIYL